MHWSFLSCWQQKSGPCREIVLSLDKMHIIFAHISLTRAQSYDNSYL